MALLCSNSEVPRRDPFLGLGRVQCSSCALWEETLRCSLRKMEKTLDPIYSAFPSFSLSLWLPEEPEHQQGGGSAGDGKECWCLAFSSLLLLLQVLGALFLAIGLWAWSEKVRQWDMVQGCYGLRWWEGQSPSTCLCSPCTGRSLQHLGTDRSGRP